MSHDTILIYEMENNCATLTVVNLILDWKFKTKVTYSCSAKKTRQLKSVKTMQPQAEEKSYK